VPIIETIYDDLNKALKVRDKPRLSILRLVKAEVMNREIEKKSPLDDNEVKAVLKTFVNRGKDSIDQFTKAGRTELVEKEKLELAVVQHYLPRQLSDEETRAMILDTVQEMGVAGPKDMGKVMKAVMGKAKGLVDGKLANKLLKEILEA
jgi:uncharacterized protein YqeY